MKKIFLLPFLLISSFGFSQQPFIEWQKSLGGSGLDFANSIEQTTDGGYIVAGFSNSTDGDVTGNHGGSDYWVVKLDVSGNITWQKTLGGSGNDNASSIQQTTDGGYIVAGKTDSNDGDVSGNFGLWDIWVLKLDASGSITWKKLLGGSLSESASSIQQTTDGGYIVSGESDSNDGDVTVNNGFTDSWIVKLDASGNITWEKSLGGSQSEYSHSIQQTTDGGYIVAGYSNSNDGDVIGNQGMWDYWVLKLDVFGNIIWQKSLGGTSIDKAYSIKQTMDGGYILAGYSSSNSGDISLNDYWAVKLDTAGGITWQKSLGGSGDDWANSIQQTTDGGYIVAGWSNSNDGDVTGSNGNNDYWIVKLSPDISSINENESFKLSVYPNPTTKTFTISSENVINSAFKIIDAEGKEVLSDNLNGKEQTIDISNLSKGVYSVVFDNSGLPVLTVIKE
jgi:hypothetical protein